MKERKWIDGWEGGWMDGIVNIPQGHVGGPFSPYGPIRPWGIPQDYPGPSVLFSRTKLINKDHILTGIY